MSHDPADPPPARRGTTWPALVTSLVVAIAGLAVGASGVAMAAHAPATAARALPRIDATSPGSPSGELRPTVVGRAAARSRVTLFTGAGCIGQPLGSTVATRTGRFSIRTPELAFGARTRLSALAQGAAGHAPTCTAAVTFQHLGVTVAMRGDQYLPSSITIRRGTLVRWRNDDTDLHASASDGATAQFATANATLGHTVQHAFATPGTFAYHCPEHPGMTGTITVT